MTNNLQDNPVNTGDKKYEPELGQAFLGKPYKEYQASELLIAVLNHIRHELERVMNNNDVDFDDPFGNSGGRYVNDTFEVYAYSWDDTVLQPYNFRYQDIDVSWYKYLGRGTTVNRRVTAKRLSTMLDECLVSIRKEEKDILYDF